MKPPAGDPPTAANRAPEVTVVIPAYNLSSYLPDAVQSVQQQDYRGPLSVIVLDDGSSDSTLQVAQRLARDATNITVHTQLNQGRAKTRNRLLQLARSELVAWLDADDLASPSWLTDQVAYLNEHTDCVAVSGQGYSMTARGNAIGPIEHPLSGDEIDRRHLVGEANAFFQSCVTLRKSAALRAGGYNERYPCAEDYDLWLRLAEIGSLANVTACHLFYRVHATSANWTVNVEQRRQGHAIMNEARQRRGLALLEGAGQAIPPAKKDDWNRRLYWINIALRSGNPVSALEMLGPALRRHPGSLLLWLAVIVAVGDTVRLLGNRTAAFRPGQRPRFGTLPTLSCYRLGRALVRLRRRLLA
jgi:glycosyltransferase involved in cell wall biosynthesis